MHHTTVSCSSPDGKKRVLELNADIQTGKTAAACIVAVAQCKIKRQTSYNNNICLSVCLSVCPRVSVR